MALNKSSKSTPSSRSGYFTELTSSTGKQTNFLLPVRLKITPNNSLAPLSDGKKNPSMMLQPVLIKDLFKSSPKDKRYSSVASVSTQKKKARVQRTTQPYLNTQSCYKPKQDEVEECSYFSRKSCGESKVRRQLYQGLDSPQKSTLENKENNKVTRLKKKITKESEELTEGIQSKNKGRKSFLLPPNSIKNTFLKISTSKTSSKQNLKSNVTNVNKLTKNSSRITETRKVKTNLKKTNHIEEANDIDVDSNASLSNSIKYDVSCILRDQSTMTSPIRGISVYKSLSNLNKSERPSVIMSPSKVNFTSKESQNSESSSSQTNNLCADKMSCNCVKKSETLKGIEFNFTKMNFNLNGFSQLKLFLEQSIKDCEEQASVLKQSVKACEQQASTLKQVLNLLNNEMNNTSTISTSESNKSFEISEKSDISNLNMIISQDNSDATEIINENTEEKDENNLVILISENEKEKVNVPEKLPIPLKILVSDVDLNQEATEISSEMLNEMARLSTIGEVSCEVDDSNKDEKNCSENKENIDISIQNIQEYIENLTIPRTPKTPRRRSTAVDSCDSYPRRRSARLAARRKSISTMDSDSDKQDSFTMLEEELNIHNKMPSKSLPASPMKPPMTPGVIRQWGKNVERPLKEYMALKMNGTFLVTPDVKRFQSRLESSDTPHSRKSLSRKIFMELCDLYAESPEPK